MPRALALLDAPVRAVVMDTEGTVYTLVGLFWKGVGFIDIRLGKPGVFRGTVIKRQAFAVACTSVELGFDCVPAGSQSCGLFLVQRRFAHRLLVLKPPFLATRTEV